MLEGIGYTWLLQGLNQAKEYYLWRFVRMIVGRFPRLKKISVVVDGGFVRNEIENHNSNQLLTGRPHPTAGEFEAVMITIFQQALGLNPKMSHIPSVSSADTWYVYTNTGLPFSQQNLWPQAFGNSDPPPFARFWQAEKGKFLIWNHDNVKEDWTGFIPWDDHGDSNDENTSKSSYDDDAAEDPGDAPEDTDGGLGSDDGADDNSGASSDEDNQPDDGILKTPMVTTHPKTSMETALLAMTTMIHPEVPMRVEKYTYGHDSDKPKDRQLASWKIKPSVDKSSAQQSFFLL